MQPTNTRRCLPTSVFLLILLCTTTLGKTIYVDINAPGTNDGSSWDNAYNYLQDALDSSSYGDEIYIAQGIYTPDRGFGFTAGNRSAMFSLKNGVALRGGYAGFAEPDLNSRDIERFKTILSGDLSGDDIYVNDPCDLRGEASRFDNSHNVVRTEETDETAVLDGFTITAGYISFITRNGPIGGAGMLNISSNPTIINCTFTGNAVLYGGGAGLFNRQGSNPFLVNCIFTGNYAASGAGVRNSESDPNLTNCIFYNNYARRGGAIYNYNSNPTLTNCTFSHNRANEPTSYNDTMGGAMFNSNSILTLVDCLFTDNVANFGGAIYNDENIDSILIRCLFVGNSAESYGGAIFDRDSDSRSVFTNCTFTGNSTKSQGGAMYVASATLTNCFFTGNRALGYYRDDGTWIASNGGAVLDARTTIFHNCTFSKNWAQLGCAIGKFYPLSLQVYNCILWGFDNQIYNPVQADIHVKWSAVQGGWPEGGGNIDVDPYFVDPGRWVASNDQNQAAEPNDPNAVWIDGDYHLKSQAGRWDPETQSWVKDDLTSPCIDAGDPMSPIGYEPFPNGSRINMGAYGGTAEASKSYFGGPVCETIIAGDINGDCMVDFSDFAIISFHWLQEQNP